MRTYISPIVKPKISYEFFAFVNHQQLADPRRLFLATPKEYELFPFVDLWQNRTLSTSISVSHSRREFPTRVWHWISEFGISESGTELCPEFAFLGHFPLTVFLLLLFPFLWSDVRFLFVCVFVLSYRLFEW